MWEVNFKTDPVAVCAAWSYECPNSRPLCGPVWVEIGNSQDGCLPCGSLASPKAPKTNPNGWSDLFVRRTPNHCPLHKGIHLQSVRSWAWVFPTPTLYTTPSSGACTLLLQRTWRRKSVPAIPKCRIFHQVISACRGLLRPSQKQSTQNLACSTSSWGPQLPEGFTAFPRPDSASLRAPNFSSPRRSQARGEPLPASSEGKRASDCGLGESRVDS